MCEFRRDVAEASARLASIRPRVFLYEIFASAPLAFLCEIFGALRQRSVRSDYSNPSSSRAGLGYLLIACLGEYFTVILYRFHEALLDRVFYFSIAKISATKIRPKF